MPNQRERIVEVLTGVYDFYGRELSDFAATVWLQACEQFEVEQVSKAMSAHLMDPDQGQFLPKPADIVRQLQGTHTDRSLLAWGRVLKAMESVGAYGDVDFGDPAIHAAIEDAGGWVTICRTTYDELPFVQRRFTEAYRVYSRRPPTEAPKSLQGAHSAANITRGLPAAPTRRLQSPEGMAAGNVLTLPAAQGDRGVA